MVHWCNINAYIFEQKGFVVQEDVIKIVAYYNKIELTKRCSNKRQCRYKDIWNEFPVGYFDGACS